MSQAQDNRRSPCNWISRIGFVWRSVVYSGARPPSIRLIYAKINKYFLFSLREVLFFIWPNTPTSAYNLYLCNCTTHCHKSSINTMTGHFLCRLQRKFWLWYIDITQCIKFIRIYSKRVSVLTRDSFSLVRKFLAKIALADLYRQLLCLGREVRYRFKSIWNFSNLFNSISRI